MAETITTETMAAETTETKSERILRVGPDQVTITETELIIDAKHAMPDWEVRDLDPVPVYFEEKKYVLVHKTKAQSPYALRYLLQPWPEGETTASKRFHTYDAEAVQEREGTLRTGHLEDLVRAFLLLAYPFLGFLWSGMQKRLIRFGFIPHAITGISIFTTFAALFGEGVFVTVLINASVHSGKLMLGGFIQAVLPWSELRLGPLAIPVGVLDILLIVACLVDISVRFGRHAHEDQWAGGFLEWLLPRSRQASAEES